MLQKNKTRSTNSEYCKTCAKSYYIPKHNPNPVIEFDSSFNLLYANQAATNTVLKYFDSAFYSHLKSLSNKALEEGKTELDFYYSLKKKHYRIYTVLTKDGYYLLFAVDITKEIKLSEQVQEREEFTHRIIDNIPVDIALFDKTHKYLYLNKIAVNNDEIRAWLINKTDFDYFKHKGLSTDPAKHRRSLFTKAIAQKNDVEFIDKIEKGGGVKYVLRRYHPVVTNNNVTEVIGYGVDITDQILAQKKLIKAHNAVFENQLLLNQLLHHFVHNIKHPIANIEGLLDSYSFENEAHVENNSIMKMLQTSFTILLENIAGITNKLDNAKYAYKTELSVIDIQQKLAAYKKKWAGKSPTTYKFRVSGNIVLHYYPYMFNRILKNFFSFISHNINKQTVNIVVAQAINHKYHTITCTINNIHVSQAKLKKYTESISNATMLNYELNLNYLADISYTLNYSGGYFTIDYSKNKLCFSFNFPKL